MEIFPIFSPTLPSPILSLAATLGLSLQASITQNLSKAMGPLLGKQSSTTRQNRPLSSILYIVTDTLHVRAYTTSIRPKYHIDACIKHILLHYLYYFFCAAELPTCITIYYYCSYTTVLAISLLFYTTIALPVLTTLMLLLKIMSYNIFSKIYINIIRLQVILFYTGIYSLIIY